MASSIHARFQGTDIDLENASEERKLLFSELCRMTAVVRFGLLDNAVCGSQTGCLYLFRFPALVIERLKVLDFRHDLVRKKEMAATRAFSGHTSMI